MTTKDDLNDKFNWIPRHQPIVKFGDDEYICDDINETFIRHGEPINLIGFERLIEVPADSSSYLVYDQVKHTAGNFPALNSNIPHTYPINKVNSNCSFRPIRICYLVQG